jgi:hypothetical protein
MPVQPSYAYVIIPLHPKWETFLCLVMLCKIRVLISLHASMTDKSTLGLAIPPLPHYAFVAWCSVQKSTGSTLPQLREGLLPFNQVNFILKSIYRCTILLFYLLFHMGVKLCHSS